MAGKSYLVTGPLATPYREDGSRAYLYQNVEWPDGLREGETERFLDLGLIGEVEKASETEGDKPPAKKAAAKKSTSAASGE